MRYGTTLVVAAMLWAALGAGDAAAKDEPREARLWAYAQAVGLISPNWAVSVMPGMRWEIWDSEGDAGQATMYELFAGPIFIQKLGPITLKIPLWYYYMGFPIRKPGKDDYFDSHNLEVIPIFSFGTGRWTFTSRTILHSKVYARNAVFKTEQQRRGYSLLWRQLFRASYAILPALDLTLAEELFIGVVEDGETNGLAKGEPFFEKHGFSMNRVYAGVVVKLPAGMSLSPQYIFETHHDPDRGSKLTKMRHYLFVTWSMGFKLF